MVTSVCSACKQESPAISKFCTFCYQPFGGKPEPVCNPEPVNHTNNGLLQEQKRASSQKSYDSALFELAQKALKQAAIAASGLGILQLLIAAFLSDFLAEGMAPALMLNALILIGLGTGTGLKSRICAWLLFVLQLLGTLMLLTNPGKIVAIGIAVMLTWHFFQAAVHSLNYHRIKAQKDQPE